MTNEDKIVRVAFENAARAIRADFAASASAGAAMLPGTSLDGKLIIEYDRDSKPFALPTPALQVDASGARHDKALARVSPDIKAGWFSQRVHGRLTPNAGTNRGTIVNTREKLGRNRRVSINGAAPVKVKRAAFYSNPVPTQVV